MRQFAGNQEAVFDADPEPPGVRVARQPGPPPQEMLADQEDPTDADSPVAPEPPNT